MQGGTLSPLILAFFPLVALSWRRGRPLRSGLLQTTAAAALGLVAFTILRPRVFAPRYVLAPLLILILPAAAGAQLAVDSRRGGVLSVAIIAALLLVTGGRFGQDVSQIGEDAVKYTWGRLVDPKRLPPDATSAALLNSRAGRDERVILASHNCYWVRCDLIRNHVVLAEHQSFKNLKTDQGRWRWLYDRGVRLILLDARGDLGSDTADGVVLNLSLYPKPASPVALSTGRVPEDLAVKVLDSHKDRIVLELRRTSAPSTQP